MTGIINYGAGNLHSVAAAIKACGEEVFVIERPRDMQRADNIILPGVGAFADGMKNLAAAGFIGPLTAEVKRGKPLLGICLGLQLLFSYSEEGDCRGFDWISGRVAKFCFEERSFRVPHMGWNRLRFLRRDALFAGIPDDRYFYFAHSYYPRPDEDKVTLGLTCYGIDFASVIKKKNLVGVQFHPEKSGVSGLRFISNFMDGDWL